MATKLWDKGYDLNPEIEAFEVGDDVVYDNRLILADVLGSIAHAAGLTKVGLLTRDEFAALRSALAAIAEEAAAGTFRVEPGDEDVHTKIEHALTARTGEPGKKIHTARSRNDQVIVDLRLFLKQEAPRVERAILDCADALLSLAERHRLTPMPGYTHMQRAMLSSVGVWAGAYLEALLDDLTLLDAALDLNDQCPLGSAASYGVPFPIDRRYVSDLLGFRAPQRNVLYAQNARGKFEAAVVQALSQVMLDLSKLAQDILLFTTAEFGFFTIGAEFTTGSSIMPQKKNLGAMEMLRAKGSVMLAYQQQIMTVLAGLPSGYNMDYQETKRPFIDALDLTARAARVAALTVRNLEPNEQALLAACTPDLFATDAAYELVAEGVPFRDAYRRVGTALETVPPMDPHEQLAKRTHLGTAGDLGLEESARQIAARRERAAARAAAFEAMAERLLAGPIPGLD
ncbi:argininosuccinate lyase [Sphaerobacter thermophilus]|uniref:Argininosuccinate lyase n=1 Tax=Sphaerobacter thermophilus (strain ATCC 49802 / DSM 20745 / KCCM 41009 / NCIMB 13125 / S 6022) TaxID=479434 RepID=D1C6A6_SPHTD|nr:argininosuccinate lyase [Sphaerobacter thermophilus]ACZ37644.1 argininosuccinate lyase [Sphaerobacter thermophilus DSM 20745]